MKKLLFLIGLTALAASAQTTFWSDGKTEVHTSKQSLKATVYSGTFMGPLENEAASDRYIVGVRSKDLMVTGFLVTVDFEYDGRRWSEQRVLPNTRGGTLLQNLVYFAVPDVAVKILKLTVDPQKSTGGINIPQ